MPEDSRIKKGKSNERLSHLMTAQTQILPQDPLLSICLLCSRPGSTLQDLVTRTSPGMSPLQTASQTCPQPQREKTVFPLPQSTVGSPELTSGQRVEFLPGRLMVATPIPFRSYALWAHKNVFWPYDPQKTILRI